MKFKHPEFEKVMFEELDVVLQVSDKKTTIIEGYDYDEEDFFGEE